MNALIRMIELIHVEGKKKMYRRIKTNINRVVKKDMQIKEVMEDITLDLTKWQKKIREVDPY